jgi:hypothetical protein
MWYLSFSAWFISFSVIFSALTKGHWLPQMTKLDQERPHTPAIPALRRLRQKNLKLRPGPQSLCQGRRMVCAGKETFPHVWMAIIWSYQISREVDQTILTSDPSIAVSHQKDDTGSPVLVPLHCPGCQHLPDLGTAENTKHVITMRIAQRCTRHSSLTRRQCCFLFTKWRGGWLLYTFLWAGRRALASRISTPALATSISVLEVLSAVVCLTDLS